MIKNLIFDFGKVLVDYDFGAFFRSYIADPKRLAAFTPVLYNEELQQMLDREARPFDEIMEEIIERMGNEQQRAYRLGFRTGMKITIEVYDQKTEED